MLKPSEETFFLMSSEVSSKVISTPGSLNSSAPRTRNSVAKSDLPQPAAPQTSVGLPAGSPPPVISSKPPIPVGTFLRILDDPIFFPLPCCIRLNFQQIREIA